MSTPMDKGLPRHPTDFEMDLWDERGWDESWEEIEPVPPPVRARANAFDDIFDGYGEGDDFDEQMEDRLMREADDLIYGAYERYVLGGYLREEDMTPRGRRISFRRRLDRRWNDERFDHRVRQLAKSWNCSKQEARDRFWGELTPRKRRPRREFPRIIKRRRQYE